MAPKTMEYELTGGRRGDETLPEQAPPEGRAECGRLLTVILRTNLPMTPTMLLRLNMRVTPIPLRALFEGWWLSTATCLHQRLEPDAQRAPGPAIAGASPALTVSVAQGGGGETGGNPRPAVPTLSVSRDTSATAGTLPWCSKARGVHVRGEQLGDRDWRD